MNVNWTVTLTNTAEVAEQGLVWAESAVSASRIAFGIANGANNVSGDLWSVDTVELSTRGEVKHLDDVLNIPW